MIEIREITEEHRSTFENFVLKYGDRYEVRDLKEVTEWFGEGIKLKDSRNEHLQEVYAYLGLLDDEDNRFKKYLKFIKEHYDLGTDITMIGGGYIPVLAMYIAEEQKKLNRGTLTIYDPKIVFDKLDHMTIVKDRFLEDTPIGNTKLILAEKPCTATYIIKRTANEYPDVDVWFSYCECGPTPFYDDGYLPPEEWCSIETSSMRFEGINAYSDTVKYGNTTEYMTYTKGRVQ